jgi:hypothetical protein
MRKLMVFLLSLLVALVVSVPLGGYRLLPTELENCFTPETPCGKLSGEQRSP